ncbi:hypothetical protein F511_45186 [Dorcoceras hygrometricum]|uniref:Uncharacterized protein n=1 Tax=Dorcoceras hygrometricum TaxID=472368 RepID=A0A2Z7A4D8_9LAMI|nr:hypothetical protein F511_45186 [Dorcoceras hygrometricum]
MRSCARYCISCDDISLDVINQQLAISRRSCAKEMKRRRAGESADGLAFMTSSVTSSYSADDLREQSQESAAPLTRVRDVGAITAQLQKYIDYTVHQQKGKRKERRSNRPPLQRSFHESRLLSLD